MLFPDCWKEVENVSLVAHLQTHHGVAKGRLGQEGNEAEGGNKTRTYSMMFPAKDGPRPCPVEGCSGWSSTQTDMRVQLWNWHVRDTVVILEEGNLPD